MLQKKNIIPITQDTHEIHNKSYKLLRREKYSSMQQPKLRSLNDNI